VGQRTADFQERKTSHGAVRAGEKAERFDRFRGLNSGIETGLKRAVENGQHGEDGSTSTANSGKNFTISTEDGRTSAQISWWRNVWNGLKRRAFKNVPNTIRRYG
jgi:hypothetical protein